MPSIYVETRVGDLAIGYTYFKETDEYQMKGQIGGNRAVQYVSVEDVPEAVKKAVCFLLEEDREG